MEESGEFELGLDGVLLYIAVEKVTDVMLNDRVILLRF